MYVLLNFLTLFSGDSVSTIEVYDPILERWQIVDAMKMLRSRVGGTFKEFNSLCSEHLVYFII
jgi:hypothetical protein